MAKNSKTEAQQGGYNDFTLVEKFNLGYRNREDITTLPPGVMVRDSQNVLTNTFQRVGIRKGFTLDGQANDDLAPIANDGPAMGVFDWETSGGIERNMRAGFLTSAGNDGKLQFRNVLDDGTVEWTDLLTDLTSVDFNFITFWDTSSLKTMLLMVNGTSNIYAWSGATIEIVSGANPTGIIALVAQPGEDTPGRVSGGKDFTAGDLVNISGGGNDAQITVTSVHGSGQIDSAAVNVGGAGFNNGDQFVISNGSFDSALGTVVSNSGGAVTAFSIQNPGEDFTVDTGFVCTATSGGGTGLTIDVTGITGGGIRTWAFALDSQHGTGYTANTKYTITGGTGTLAYIYVYSVDSGTILKSGTETWAQSGFLFATGVGTTRTVIINGTTYTYDSGNFLGNTTTLYGVTPDPSGLSAGDVVVQGVVTIPNTGASDGLPVAFHNDLIGTLNGHVFIGSLTSSFIYVSETNSYTTWTGNAGALVLNAPPKAFINQEEQLYISSGQNEWFLVNLDLVFNTVFINEFQIHRLNTAAQQSAQSQAWTTKIANQIAFLSFEPVMEAFGPVQNILGVPQMVDLSYSIVNDMNAYDFTGGSAAYFRKMLYMAVPREGLVLIYNMTDPANPYWEAPQVMPISRFSIIEGELYGHSSQVSETYKLFTGTNDNGHAIAANVTFSFNNYGTRTETKGYNNFYVEGYILPNTPLNLNVQYDIDGCATFTSFTIDGDDTQIVCIPKDDGSLGKASLGKHPLGEGLTTIEDTGKPKFRVIKTFPTNYFYEDQISFSSTGTDLGWEIVAFGPQLLDGGNLNNSITQ